LKNSMISKAFSQRLSAYSSRLGGPLRLAMLYSVHGTDAQMWVTWNLHGVISFW
jgi:hypothetical protein